MKDLLDFLTKTALNPKRLAWSALVALGLTLLGHLALDVPSHALPRAAAGFFVVIALVWAAVAGLRDMVAARRAAGDKPDDAA